MERIAIANLIEAAFSTDPRVIHWARTKFEVKPDDKKGLVEAKKRLYEMAEKGVMPQAEWLKNAKDLAERLGQAWDVKDEPAEAVTEQAKKHAEERTHSPDLVRKDLLTTPTRVRHITLGIPATIIVPGAMVTVCIQPYLTFRLQRIVLSDEIASSLLIHDLKIGKYCQFGNVEPIGGSVFAARAFPLPMNCDTAQLSQLISLTVSNTSMAGVLITGALQGLGVE